MRIHLGHVSEFKYLEYFLGDSGADEAEKTNEIFKVGLLYVDDLVLCGESE